MPAPQPPYPSFTWVMSATPFAAHDNMRLPAYRASHLARFHPYPRAHPSLHETTQRFSEHSKGPVRGVTPITPAMDPKDNGKTENKSETSTVAAESILRRQKLKTAADRLSVRKHTFSCDEHLSCVPYCRLSSSLCVVCIAEHRRSKPNRVCNLS
ncbi:hypothetical protein BJV74DRAFT_7974 [Russula compacta]|nr:hypothetical protein BJV74DRAFT_7974 [Russula compacta]